MRTKTATTAEKKEGTIRLRDNKKEKVGIKKVGSMEKRKEVDRETVMGGNESSEKKNLP